MDRFEYPNVLGQNPLIVVTYREADALCRSSAKRLCGESEWTFACEGEEARPYPYGFARDASACVVDRDWRPFKEGALQPRDGEGAARELDRLWQAEPSGSRPSCRSPFGVYDMTGNVDEWTRSARATGRASVLKGGYWGPVRARCRPATRAHDEDFVAYQQGFRCCADADGSVAAPERATLEAAARPPASTPDQAAGASGRGRDLTAEWSSRARDDGDEEEALGRARVALRCDLAREGTGAARGLPVVHAFALLMAVAVLRGRHGRRRRSAAGLGAEDASVTGSPGRARDAGSPR